ncbi:MAG TPA: hypothetical protein VHW69_14930 [Rhizomicrobium sp.]|jgi:hypothetical protein|nr:hypothetical protein [Rhizomicrobium sp.]
MQPHIRLIELISGRQRLELSGACDEPAPVYLGLIDGQLCVRSPDKAEAMRKLLSLAGKDRPSGTPAAK